MCAIALRILVVGAILPSTRTALGRLGNHGWGYQSVETLREAISLLATFQFDVLLSAENLRDGRGYDLIPETERCGASLLVSVSLSENCLWLPVVENGERTLGTRGLNPRMLEAEIESMLAVRGASPNHRGHGYGDSAKAGGDPVETENWARAAKQRG